MNEATETTKLLTQLAVGGLGAVLVSFAAEKSEKFQSLAPATKAWLMLAFTLAIALLAQAAILYLPAEWLLAMEPFVKVAVPLISAWLVSQGFHAVQKAVNRNK